MSENLAPDTPDTPPGSATEVQHSPPHLLVDPPATGADTVPGNIQNFAGTERYQLLDEIARGGMGVVYLARDNVLGREVGVKTLLKVPAEESVIAARFREEARITGQLQHPNIPPVHDLGTLPDGRPYLAMKLIKGRTLDAMLKDRPDPSHERGKYLAIFEQIAQGVAYAHAHRVIHRDLKPMNVMVGAFGEVQVMDWGLAKILTDSPAKTVIAPQAETGAATDIRATRDEGDETRAGSVLGTPAYMPPEQAIGAVDQIDTRSDVFGLGAVLCAILTSTPPYVGADAESTRQLAARARLHDAFTRIDSCGAEPALIALCKRCLSSERDDRPRDARAVAKTVAELRTAAEQRARQAELDRVRAEEKAAEQRKRRKVQLALLASVMLLVTGGGAFAWWQDKQETKRQIEAERLASEKREREARNRDAFVVSLERCETALRVGDAETADTTLKDVNERLAEGGTEGFERRVARCRKELVILKELDQIDRFRWSPVDGQRPDKSAVVAKWKKTIGAFGIVPGTTPTTEIARLMSDALIRDRLLTTMDLWLVFVPSGDLVELLKKADQDAYRDAVRDAVRHLVLTPLLDQNYIDRVVKLDILVRKDAALEQPPRFAVVIGEYPIKLERRRIMLERVIFAQPGNTAAFMAMIATYHTIFDDNAEVDERLRWCQAAAAARPRNAAVLAALGDAYYLKGNHLHITAA